MTDAVTVAEDILTLAHRRGILLTPLDLLQLTYFAYGLHFYGQNERLFDEPIEAWNIGPVVPSVFEKFKKHGADMIPSEAIPSELRNKDLEPLLDVVLNTYGLQVGPKLRKLIKNGDTPWKRAYKPNQIPDEYFEEYYRDVTGKSKSERMVEHA